MSIASSTYSVIADNFYCVSFMQASLSVREDSDGKIEWVVVDAPMSFFPTCLQTWSKLGDDCIKETLWWYGIFEKQRSLLINFFMRCKRTVMPFDDMLPRQARYFYLNQSCFTRWTLFKRTFHSCLCLGCAMLYKLRMFFRLSIDRHATGASSEFWWATKPAVCWCR